MKDFLKSILGIGVFILLLVGGLALLRNITRQSSVILSDTTCQPPCWKTIQPGVTTADEVFAIVSEMESVDPASLQENTTPDGAPRNISWIFTRPLEDLGGTIYYEDERVSLISIHTLNSLKLSAIIDKLGLPSQYWTAIGQGENREYVTVGLLAPAQGYQVELLIDLEGKTNAVAIEAKTLVYAVKYFNPDDLAELLTENNLIPNTAAQDALNLPAWNGLGRLDFHR